LFWLKKKNARPLTMEFPLPIYPKMPEVAFEIQNNMKKFLLILFLLIGSVDLWAAYPEKPIVLVVPFPAGGPADAMGRSLAHAMGAKLGATVVVENKVGAGGLLGVAFVANAAADGYTLGMAGTGAMIYAPFITKKMPFDPITGLTHVTTLVRTPNVLVVQSRSPYKSLADLVNKAKEHPGTLTYASAGVASSAHVVAELFQKLAGVKLVHVPYKGAAPALQDLMGGHVDLMIGEVSGLVGQIKTGGIRGLALSDTQRLAALKDVPSALDVGLPAWVADGAYGLVAPLGLPSDLLKKWVEVANEALASEEVINKFAELTSLPQAGNPTQYKNLIQSEQLRWSTVIKSAGISDE
jgi:tripartite-type tricarboxylate transporter receptor subunit TctC